MARLYDIIYIMNKKIPRWLGWGLTLGGISTVLAFPFGLRLLDPFILPILEIERNFYTSPGGAVDYDALSKITLPTGFILTFLICFALGALVGLIIEAYKEE